MVPFWAEPYHNGVTDIPPSNALRTTHGGGRRRRRTGFLLAPKGLKPFEITTLGRILTDAASNLILLGGNGQCSMPTTPSITVIFKVGTDMNTALMLTHNSCAGHVVPASRGGPAPGRAGQEDHPSPARTSVLTGWLSQRRVHLNYFVLNVRDQIARLPGVANFWVLGERQYAMRIWIDPNKAPASDISTSDILTILRAQNAQVSAGALNQPPVFSDTGSAYQINIRALGRLSTPEQFGDIIVKSDSQGRPYSRHRPRR
jgi:multidrug efflux pump subunit AcrB